MIIILSRIIDDSVSVQNTDEQQKRSTADFLLDHVSVLCGILEQTVFLITFKAYTVLWDTSYHLISAPT